MKIRTFPGLKQTLEQAPCALPNVGVCVSEALQFGEVRALLYTMQSCPEGRVAEECERWRITNVAQI